MDPDSTHPGESIRGALSAALAEHADDALRSASIGRWAWDPRTDECVWSWPDATQPASEPELSSGRLVDLLAAVSPTDRDGLVTALQRQRIPGGAIHHTFHLVRADGTAGRVHIDGVVVRGHDGEATTVGVARDETSQMLLDERLASSFALRDRVARALEASLLPPTLPGIPGFGVDADYRSSEGASTGDFYDLFPLPGDDWGLTIGDVGGHGTAAAAITTAIRYTLRAAANVRKSPIKVMAAANEVHFAAVQDERFTTAHYVRIHRQDRDVQLRVATAGHPDIVIVRSSGRIEALAGTGPMLGLLGSASFVEGRANLGPGDLVVAYTDGVIEARRDGVQFGREKLETFLASWTGDVAGCAAALHDAAVEYSDGSLSDDMATVVLQRLD